MSFKQNKGEKKTEKKKEKKKKNEARRFQLSGGDVIHPYRLITKRERKRLKGRPEKKKKRKKGDRTRRASVGHSQMFAIVI
jgi:hypothetical protein